LSDHEIILGDCLAGMRGLEAGSVDVTITDPPFASEIYERCKKNPARSSSSRGGSGGNTVSPGLLAMTQNRIGTLDDVLGEAMKEIARVTRRWVLVFCDVESVHLVRAALELNGMRHIRTGAWGKNDPMPQFSGDRPAQGFEVCELAYGEGRPRWNGGGKAALWMHSICKGNERPEHPCPKPESLMEELVRDFSDLGELVMDPFAGSGTTGVACKRLGRRFLGFERDPKFHAAAVKRLEAAREQFNLPMRQPKAKQGSLLP
jgi:DNA modification methylase